MNPTGLAGRLVIQPQRAVAEDRQDDFSDQGTPRMPRRASAVRSLQQPGGKRRDPGQAARLIGVLGQLRAERGEGPPARGQAPARIKVDGGLGRCLHQISDLLHVMLGTRHRIRRIQQSRNDETDESRDRQRLHPQ